MFDFNLLKKPQEYGAGKGTALGRPLKPEEVHTNFLVLAEVIVDHEGQNITDSRSVHGILQGHENGFNADLLDGKHVSELVHSVVDNATDTASIVINQAITTISLSELGLPRGLYRFMVQPLGTNTMFLSHVAIDANNNSITLYAFYHPSDDYMPAPGAICLHQVLHLLHRAQH